MTEVMEIVDFPQEPEKKYTSLGGKIPKVHSLWVLRNGQDLLAKGCCR
jgi:ATP-dependent Zn protease